MNDVIEAQRKPVQCPILQEGPDTIKITIQAIYKTTDQISFFVWKSRSDALGTVDAKAFGKSLKQFVLSNLHTIHIVVYGGSGRLECWMFHGDEVMNRLHTRILK